MKIVSLFGLLSCLMLTACLGKKQPTQEVKVDVVAPSADESTSEQPAV